MPSRPFFFSANSYPTEKNHLIGNSRFFTDKIEKHRVLRIYIDVFINDILWKLIELFSFYKLLNFVFNCSNLRFFSRKNVKVGNCFDKIWTSRLFEQSYQVSLKLRTFYFCANSYLPAAGIFSDTPEVVISVSIDLKFTGYLATVITLLHIKFYGDRSLTFWVISF